MKRTALILSITVLLLTSCKTKQFPQKEYDKAYEALISENYTQEAAKQFARLPSKYSVYPEIWYQYRFPATWKRVITTPLYSIL